MRSILVLVFLGLAWQKSLAFRHTRMVPEEEYDDLTLPFAKDPFLSKLEAIEKHEAEQTVIVSKLQSSFDDILEKLTKIENQIAGRNAAQSVEIMEDWQKPTEGPVSEEIDQKLLENYVKIGAKYYHIENDEPLIWFEALTKCKSLNGSLLSLQNEGEWRAVTARLNRNASYWVDLNDVLEEGKFISATSGKAGPYFKWDIAEPNNRDFSLNFEDCVELRSAYNHYMNDINCFNENYYVCEADLKKFSKEIQHQ